MAAAAFWFPERSIYSNSEPIPPETRASPPLSVRELWRPERSSRKVRATLGVRDAVFVNVCVYAFPLNCAWVLKEEKEKKRWPNSRIVVGNRRC